MLIEHYACKVDLEEEECVSKQYLEADPENAAGYVWLSNIYAASGNWVLSDNVQQQRKATGVKKPN
jgi:hypothetical protein